MPFVEVSTTPLEKVASVGYALYKYFAPQKRHPVILNEFTTDDKKNKTIKKSKEKRRKSISNNLSRSDSKDSKSGSAGSDTQATMTNQAVTGSGSLDLGSDAAQSTPETTEEQLEEYATDLEIAKNLNKKILGEQGKFLSYDGAKVDYAALAESRVFKEFRRETAVLKKINVEAMSEVELMAFFLNVYNMLTVHGLTKLRPATVLAVKNFWENTCYNIGGDIYSLDIIEHGILRRNKVHPDGKKTALPEGDPRATLLSTADPRIHFALNCGAKSCPPIRIYSEMTLERGLNAATRNFVENNTKIDMAKQEITISQLFQWYKADFGESIADVMAFIETYLPEDEEDELRTQYMTLKQKVDRGETVSVGYAQYKWALNAA